MLRKRPLQLCSVEVFEVADTGVRCRDTELFPAPRRNEQKNRNKISQQFHSWLPFIRVHGWWSVIGRGCWWQLMPLYIALWSLPNSPEGVSASRGTGWDSSWCVQGNVCHGGNVVCAFVLLHRPHLL